MSCLCSAIARRRLVIICARILLQCAMASSIPQTGVDEFEVRCVRGGSSSQPMARHERKPAAPRSAVEPRCNYLQERRST
jgi:hypothetical protein